jgi:quinol monooxygenase YgiN
MVKLTFTAEVYREEFLNDFTIIAEYVSQYEPSTLAYHVVLSDNDPLQVLIVERYTTKDDYLKIHKISPAFLEFRPKLKAMEEAKNVIIEGQSFFDSGIGFGDRAKSSSNRLK